MSDEEHHEPISLANFRVEKFLRDLERGKYPTITAGGAPVRGLIGRMEDGGILPGDIIALFIYSAAAAAILGLDSPEEAEQFVRDTVETVLADLHQNGPEQ
jgi:hypothetical protein